MRGLKRSLLFIVISALIMSSCVTQKAKDREAELSLDSLFSSLYHPDEPGAAVLILRGDDVVYDKGFGLADLQTGAKIDGNTFFNIASCSKQFSATAILKLAQEGKLSLDDSVKKYFPEFRADFFNDITIRHLLSHTSGIGDDRPRSDPSFVLYSTDIDNVVYMKDLKELHFTPGEYYEYMNPTYQLFYQIIEKVSGKPFEEYMREEIFTPASMKNTLYFSPDKNIPNMSHGYIPASDDQSAAGVDSDRTPEAAEAARKQKESAPVIGNWKEYDYGEETFFASKADGGIYTSTHEFAEWEKALRSGAILNEQYMKEAHTPHITVTDSPFSSYQSRPYTYYGYGWFIERRPDFEERIFHTGDNGGYQIYAGRYPSSNVLLLIFENRNDDDRWSNVLAVDSIMKKAGWIK